MNLKDWGLAVTFVGALGLFGSQQYKSQKATEYIINQDNTSYRNYQDAYSDLLPFSYTALGLMIIGPVIYFTGRVRDEKRSKIGD